MIDYNSISRTTAEILIDIGCVNFNVENQYMLTSGKLSPVYCDCRKIISFTKEREILMNFAIQKLKNEEYFNNIEIIAGGETAGIPFASIMATKLNLPMIYVRKKQKSFGKKKKIEGELLGKSNVLLVEDLLTDGGSKKEFFETLRSESLNLLSTFVIFNYGIFKNEIGFKNFNSKLIYLTSWKYILDVAECKNLLSCEDINYIQKFLVDFGVKN